MGLKQKTIKGLFWSGISQTGKQISQFIITVILARLLSPDDFGLLAMAMVFINFGMIFSEMGISSALIQKQDTHDRHYYSAFWLNIIVGMVLTLMFIVFSPLIAWFYKKPELQIILMVISINYFISSFVIIQQTILTKEMDFKSLAIRDIIAVVLSGGIGIYMAIHGFGVWSLVFQSVTFTIFNAILIWALSTWRPKCQFSKSDIKDIIGFSSNLTGFNIVNYFARNIDQLLIGKFLGAQALGYYSLAYRIMLYPLQNISWIISKVMFPAFSIIQNELEKVKYAYLNMIKAIAVFTFPLMLGICIFASDLVEIMFGQQWRPIIILIRILSMCGLLQSIHTTVGGVILSQGRSDLQLRLGVLSFLFSSFAICTGLKWGIIGVALFYTVEQYIWISYAQSVANSLINLSFREFITPLKRILYYCIITYLPLIIIKNVLGTNGGVYGMFMIIALGALIYWTCIYLYEKEYFRVLLRYDGK